jgi:uncharacterized protein (TIGR03437 family)
LAVDAPVISQGGIVNGASFSGGGTVSPGLLAALFGANLSQTTAAAMGLPLPTQLAGTQVLVDGIAAPLFFVSAGQINFQLPFSISGSSAEVQVVSNGVASVATPVTVIPQTPGIFTVANGEQGAVLNEDSSANSPTNPARTDSVIQIYAVGLGAVDPPIPAGQAAGTSPPSQATETPTVTIGGFAAEVLYSGLAPGFAGVYQINARVPVATQASSALPVQIRIGDATSNTVIIATR